MNKVVRTIFSEKILRPVRSAESSREIAVEVSRGYLGLPRPYSFTLILGSIDKSFEDILRMWADE